MRNNQPRLFLTPRIGTDWGLQTDDLFGQTYYETKPTEAVQNAVNIKLDHEKLRARLGPAYQCYVERMIQEAVVHDDHFRR